MEMLLNGKVLKYDSALKFRNAARLLLVDYFESKFTDEDRAMEAALKKAADRTYSDAPYEDEDDI